MKKTLEYIVTSIVDNPDAVAIDEAEQDGIFTLTIHVDPNDVGKVIGKEGKVIRAIRNIMKIPAMKQNKRIHVTIAEVQ
jgi:uncharacterized protein